MSDRTMRFGFADPPYWGKSRKYYRDHADYGGKVDQLALVRRLEEEFPDGWVLCLSMNSLQHILPACPAPISRGAVGGGVRFQFRVLAWCKPLSQPGGHPGPLYGWEPVIMRGGRRDPGHAYPRDWLVCNPDQYTMREPPPGHVTGAKPEQFSRWVFECLAARPGVDELVDLFPGSGGVAGAWDRWSQQPRLVPAGDGARTPG